MDKMDHWRDSRFVIRLRGLAAEMEDLGRNPNYHIPLRIRGNLNNLAADLRAKADHIVRTWD